MKPYLFLFKCCQPYSNRGWCENRKGNNRLINVTHYGVDADLCSHPIHWNVLRTQLSWREILTIYRRLSLKAIFHLFIFLDVDEDTWVFFFHRLHRIGWSFSLVYFYDTAFCGSYPLAIRTKGVIVKRRLIIITYLIWSVYASKTLVLFWCWAFKGLLRLAEDLNFELLFLLLWDARTKCQLRGLLLIIRIISTETIGTVAYTCGSAALVCINCTAERISVSYLYLVLDFARWCNFKSGHSFKKLIGVQQKEGRTPHCGTPLEAG